MNRLLLAIVLSALSAQAPQAKLGTLEGTVTSFGIRSPVADASVVVQSGQFGPRRSTTTDANGRFSFTDMAPGAYAVVAQREGYLAGDDGAFVEPVAITTVAVKEGATAQLSFKLLRTSLIRGKITNSDGNPKAGLSVELLRIRYDALGRSSWEVRKGATTNDLGEYEFVGLTPGDHYLRAGQMLGAMATPSNAGNARITYYPGTSDVLAAAPIALQEGDERIAEFREREQITYSVRGRVVNSLPISGSEPLIQLRLQRSSGTALESPTSIYLPQGSDGGFEIAGVAPGDYNLLRM